MLHLALQGPEDPVIAPMTILDPGLLVGLTGPARVAGHRVDHVTLLADRTTVIRRIHRRGETFGPDSNNWDPTWSNVIRKSDS